jgi:hypothetical protein
VRMWMVNPKILCRQHLLGCHLEHHMFIGALKKRKNLKGFYENNCFEPSSLKRYHDQLVREMIERGYKHKSPLTDADFIEATCYLPKDLYNWKINSEISLKDLTSRCQRCNHRFQMENAYSYFAQRIADEIDKEIINSIINQERGNHNGSFFQLEGWKNS